jgi:hypothetical protein
MLLESDKHSHKIEAPLKQRLYKIIPELRIMSRTNFVPDLLNNLMQFWKQGTGEIQSV